MTPEELYALIQSGSPPTILDVRTRREYQAGHVPGALHRPFHSLLVKSPDFTTENALVVYCAHGPRAVAAAWRLSCSGYKVEYLKGHFTAWKRSNLPMETTNDNHDE